MTELAVVEWFAPPSYPDDDPLTVYVVLQAPRPHNCDPFILLDEIDPTPVMYERVDDSGVYMMRLRGVDLTPP